MKPPKAQETGEGAGVSLPAAVSPCPPVLRPETLRHRADFLRAASARRQGMPGFLLQARARGDASAALRVGFTCSRKIGNAVARNRAKRRLREVARAVLPRLAQPGWDYVLVARPGVTIERAFAALLGDLETALRQIHAQRPPR